MALTSTHFIKRICIVMSALLLFGFAALSGPSGALAATSVADQLLPLVGNALAESRSQDWPQVTQDLEQFEQLWKQLSAQEGQIPAADREKLETDLAAAKAAVQAASTAPDQVNAALAALAKSTNQLSADEKKTTSSAGDKQKVKDLTALLGKSLTAVESGDWKEAQSQYKKFENGWFVAESVVRKDDFATYSSLEVKRSLAHVALNLETPDANQAKTALQDLNQAMQAYLNGEKVGAGQAAAEGQKLADLLPDLDGALQDIAANDAGAASTKLRHFIEVWPTVEGEVSTRSSQAYSEAESDMSEGLQHLMTNPPNLAAAKQVIEKMRADLEPYAQNSRYTAWDAGMVLFREGLEALLVVAALLAFLRRTGNEKKQVWIWTGVGSGVVVSVVLAIVMTLLFSSVSAGNSREKLEGVMGLIAVVMMFTVGLWLHKQSNGKAWTQYIQGKMTTALATGSLWSLTLVSFLAIAREGAEMIIFYLGMASAIDQSQLLLGIGGALVVLLAICYAFLKFSARIPVRPFFLVASVLIYYIALKFLGQSVHVLQLVDWFPAHSIAGLPTVDWLGLYPTWESFGAQVVLLVLILTMIAVNSRKAATKHEVQARTH